MEHYHLLDGDTATIACAMMFSFNPRRINRGAHIKIGQFDSDNLLIREEITDGSLILGPDRAVDALFSKYILSRFEYKGANRIVVYDYPREGLRELVVNAVVHMKYRDESPVFIYVRRDKIEVFCFGGLPDGWTVDTLVNGHRSVLRNKTLANVFHDAGYVGGLRVSAKSWDHVAATAIPIWISSLAWKARPSG